MGFKQGKRHIIECRIFAESSLKYDWLAAFHIDIILFEFCINWQVWVFNPFLKGGLVHKREFCYNALIKI